MKKKWLFLSLLAIILVFAFLPINFLKAGSGNLVVNGDFAGNSFSSWSSWGDVVMVSESARVSSTASSNSGIYQLINTTEKNLIFSFDVTPRYNGSVSNIQIAFTIYKNGVDMGQAFGYFYNLPTVQLAHISFKVPDFWKQNTGAPYADFDQIKITAVAFSGCSAIFDNFKLESAAPLGTTVEVTKDAAAQGEGYLTWTIEKTVNKTLFDLVVGKTANANYTVTVAPVYHETGITVSGNINIKNTGGEAASVSYVKDKIEYKIGGGAWAEITTQDISGPFSIPSGGASDVPYSVSFAPVAGATEYQNTALVGLENSASGGGVGFQEYSYTKGFSASGGTNTSDAYADVSDSLQGYLGEAWVGDPATYKYAYTRQIGPYPDPGDYKVGNTATVTGKDTQAAVTVSKSVKVHVVGKGTIKVYKDLKAPDGKSKPLAEDKHEFKITLQQSATSGWKDVETKTIAAGGSQVFDVETGFKYRVVEAEDKDYVQMENTGPALLEKNAETKDIRLTGRQKFAIIKVYKDLIAAGGGADKTDKHLFWVKLDGGSRTMYQPFNEDFPTFFLVWPGTYTVAEFPEAGYKLGNYKGPAAAKSNGVYVIDKGSIFDKTLAIGPKIVFTSYDNGNNEIYIMNADGTGQTRLTNNPTADDYPSFSPDGSKIIFASNRDGNWEIYIMNIDGSGQTRLTNTPEFDEYPCFSPDGTKIAFTSTHGANYEIYIMNADGTGKTRLTNNPASDNCPSFSPDGTKIAFMSTRDIGGNTEIYVMNADGTGQTRLTNNPASDEYPSFSPDGTKIAFMSTRNGTYNIYIMNADGTGQTRLTNNPARDEYPSFSPDGTKIVFASYRDGNYEIYIMKVDGSGQTRLTNNPASDYDPSF
jgi:6-phosphogluconolactonase (cycloisomerase 2 family)